MKRLIAAVMLIWIVALPGCLSKTPPPTPAPVPTPAPAPVPAPEPPKPPQAIITPAQVLQGDFATLTLDQLVDGPVTIQVKGLSEQPRAFRVGGRTTSFIGFPAAARVGVYPVTVTWTGGRWEGSVEVIHKKFTEDRLIVTQQQEQILYDPKGPDEWARVFALRSTSWPHPLWAGPFRHPLDGDPKITTYFGEIRFVNGVETGRHSGMDFGVPTGTPVYAPARGRVILAERLIVPGWMVIIDHGFSLFTAYYHNNSVHVKAGDWVEPGDLIARVGSTGFSTGAHLHWTATIGNTPVDPWPLTQAAPLGIATPPSDVKPE